MLLPWDKEERDLRSDLVKRKKKKKKKKKKAQAGRYCDVIFWWAWRMISRCMRARLDQIKS